MADEYAFKGNLVRRGLIWVPAAAQPAHVDYPIEDADTRLIERIAENLGDRLPTVLLGVVCDACGCLCLPSEACPSYLCWAELDAVRASWASGHTEVWPPSDFDEGA